MRRFGHRALKWPFDSKEVSVIVSTLERYERTITLGLQVDQTTLLLDIRQRIEGVSLQAEENISIALNPCFSMPFERDPDFVDRPDIMTWIKERYTSPVGRMALVGMGGFGKSQVAIQFAHHIRDTSPQASVFWVHASSKPRFEEAYRSIADNLQLPRRNDPNVDALGLVRDWLQREEAGPWLMVLDNVDDVNLFYPSSSAGRDGAVCHPADENPAALSVQRPFAVFLPKRRNGIILVTSCSMDAAEKLTGSHKAVYRISAMDDAQALRLFHNKLQGEFDENAAANLLRTLDYIPLAITQAAAYINSRAPRISVKTYLDAFRESDKRKGSLLNRDAGDLRRDEHNSEDGGDSIASAQSSTFDREVQSRGTRPSTVKTSHPTVKTPLLPQVLTIAEAGELATVELVEASASDADGLDGSYALAQDEREQQQSVADACDAETTYSIDNLSDDPKLQYLRVFAEQLDEDLRHASGDLCIENVAAEYLDLVSREFAWKLHSESSNPFQWETSVIIHRKRKNIIELLVPGSSEIEAMEAQAKEGTLSGDDEDDELWSRASFRPSRGMVLDWVGNLDTSSPSELPQCVANRN